MIRFILSTLTFAICTLPIAFDADAQSQMIITDNLFSGTTENSGENLALTLDEDGVIRTIAAAPSNSSSASDAISGAWVTPGLFSAFSRVGLVEVGAEGDSDDRGASETPYSVSLRATDGFNPAASAVGVTRLEGLTHLALAPTGSANIFAGQGGIVSTSGGADSIKSDDGFIYVRLGEAGTRLSGGSRASAWAFFRAALRDARTYPGRYTTHADGGEALMQADANALKSAAKGDQLLLIAVDRVQDIRQVLKLAENGARLDIALVGAAEGHLIADEIAAAGVPVIIDPSQNLPARFEMIGASLDNAATLIEAGVLTAFSVFDDDSHQSRLLPQIAGIAVANGVAHEDALAAITVVPAEIFGQSRLGKIEIGRPANLVVWDGDPLELSSRPIAVYIDGKAQALHSRQTLLRDRYLAKIQAQAD